MKRIYPKYGDKEKMQVREKMQRMARDGLFSIVERKNGDDKTTYEYILQTDKVILKMTTFPCKKCMAIHVLLEDMWVAFETK